MVVDLEGKLKLAKAEAKVIRDLFTTRRFDAYVLLVQFLRSCSRLMPVLAPAHRT
jgi:hypothetical protein